MGGEGSGRKPDPTNVILRNIKPGTQKAGLPAIQFQTPIASKDGEGMFLPNVSNVFDFIEDSSKSVVTKGLQLVSREASPPVNYTGIDFHSDTTASYGASDKVWELTHRSATGSVNNFEVYYYNGSSWTRYAHFQPTGEFHCRLKAPQQTPQRVINTVYQNNSNYTILVTVTLEFYVLSLGDSCRAHAYIGASSPPTTLVCDIGIGNNGIDAWGAGWDGHSWIDTMTFSVPPGYYYEIQGSGTYTPTLTYTQETKLGTDF